MKAGLRGVATEQSPHPGRAEENESIGMKLDLFDYELPPERIAQVPARERDHSRLMRLDRRTRTVEHHRFHDLPDLLRPDDLLVVNDTRVMAARLFGRRDTGGKVEILLLKRLEGPFRGDASSSQIRFVKGTQVSIHPTRREIACADNGVKNQVHQPHGLQRFVKRARRMFGHAAAGLGNLNQFLFAFSRRGLPSQRDGRIGVPFRKARDRIAAEQGALQEISL